MHTFPLFQKILIESCGHRLITGSIYSQLLVQLCNLSPLTGGHVGHCVVHTGLKHCNKHKYMKTALKRQTSDQLIKTEY